MYSVRFLLKPEPFLEYVIIIYDILIPTLSGLYAFIFEPYVYHRGTGYIKVEPNRVHETRFRIVGSFVYIVVLSLF
jgi:hypothetical protein